MLFFLISTALAANSTDFVAHLDVRKAQLNAPATIRMVSEAGETTEFTVADDGKAPDVVAGDAQYAAIAAAAPGTFKITLVSGDRQWSADAVTIDNTDDPTDLKIVLDGDTLTAQTQASPGATGGQPTGPPTTGPAARPPGEGDVDPDSTAIPPRGAATTPPVTAPVPPAAEGGGMSDGMLFVILGLGLIVVLAVMWFWPGGRKTSSRGGGMTLTKLPEPGFLSPRLPSLSDGLQVWITEEADVSDLAGAVVASLAAHHQVLLVARTGVTIPPVAGGPVYRLNGTRPGRLADAAEQMVDDGANLAVVIVQPDASTDGVGDYADVIPAQVGGIVFARSNPEKDIPTVRVTQTEAGWTLSAGDFTLPVRADRSGLVPGDGSGAA